MRRLNILFIASLIGIVSTSCNCKKEISKVQEQRNVVFEKIDINNIAPAIDSANMLNFAIDTAWISNNILNAIISYQGEKGDVEFDLSWNGILMKSLPPKAILKIVEKHKSINGEKTVKQSVAFDLNPIMKSQSYDKIIFILKDYKWQLN